MISKRLLETLLSVSVYSGVSYACLEDNAFIIISQEEKINRSYLHGAGKAKAFIEHLLYSRSLLVIHCMHNILQKEGVNVFILQIEKLHFGEVE